MAAKKSAKKPKAGARRQAKPGNLPPKSLSAAYARSVKGGVAGRLKWSNIELKRGVTEA